MNFEAVIGLEIHVEMKTKSKMFSASPNSFGSEVNTNVNVLDIEVIDYGKGISNIEIAKQPLYTTKPDLDRSGMGFTIMENFMDSCEVESIVGMGTKVKMSKKIVKEEV